MNKNQLSIRLYGVPIGILEQTVDGKMQFSYHPDVKFPISINMPVRTEPYSHAPCEAFFGGLLPENETTRKIIGKRYGVSANNSFALLKAIGYDCAGAISCHHVEEEIFDQRIFPLTAKPISEIELAKHIKELPKKPLFLDVEGLRLSLAGVHDKAAVCLIENQIALAEQGCPTTHILKPSPAHYPGLAENEYFCLKIAERIGLPVPNIELRTAQDQTFLLVERYDRRIRNGQVERIHQEDFCQALGINSARKYQNEDGPGIKDCYELLMQTVQPAIDRNIFSAGVIFNYLIGNMDAHGKNFSLLHRSENHIRMAPFYDLICTRVYDDLTDKMAMKIGSKYDADEVLARHWQQLCKEVTYRYIAMVGLIRRIAKDMPLYAEQEKEALISKGYNHPIIADIVRSIEKNCDRIVKQFG